MTLLKLKANSTSGEKNKKYVRQSCALFRNNHKWAVISKNGYSHLAEFASK